MRRQARRWEQSAALALAVSSDMVHWQTLTNFVNDSGLVDIIDAESTNLCQRLYRVRWLP
jgi:hypothetical protein